MRLLVCACLLFPVATPLCAESISAVLEPARAVQMRSTVNGRVSELVVTDGDRVPKGLIAVQIDARVQEARVSLARVIAEAKGARVRSQRLLDQALTRQQRIREAREKGAAQAWEVVAAEQAVAIAEADKLLAEEDLKRRQSELSLEEATLAEFQVEIPFESTVLEVMVEDGEVVDAGAVIMEIGTIGELSATAFVPLDWLDDLSRDQRIEVQDANGQPIDAIVHVIDPRVDPASRTVRIELKLENESRELLPGTVILIERPA